jgi:hypothetical protein
MYFIYLDKIEDMIAFLYAQIRAAKKNVMNDEPTGIKTLSIKS